ncbi:MAG TPA: hypothetical protein VKD72_10120 [Gemmataceae bacterium]|nr:hypothetical protein [Gemmataceae bacterium]
MRRIIGSLLLVLVVVAGCGGCGNKDDIPTKMQTPPKDPPKGSSAAPF